MKIGIITVIDNNNYGNRLQNFALQEILKRFGTVYTIRNSSVDCYPTGIKKLLSKGRIKLFYLKRILKGITPLKRIKNFRNFNKNIFFTSIRYTPNRLKSSNNFDFYIVGSDQVWNPEHGRLNDFDILKGVDGKKCNSYAASFGIEQIKDYSDREKIKNEIGKFKHISVREDSGKKILKALAGRQDVEVLVDPTMLLTSEEWDKLAKKPKQMQEGNYILNYFLGELSESRKKEIEQVAKENNCYIIHLLNKNDPFYISGPLEFLYLVKHAFLICTDSFHSSIFSILYHRPFLVFDREQKNVTSMNSRIDTLLAKFHLEDRKYKGKIKKQDLECNYEKVYDILKDERKKANDFLKKMVK